MDWLLEVDWKELLTLETSLLEIFIRGSAVYLLLFLLLRLFLKRQAGTVSVTDLLVIVLIAEAAQNALSTDHHSLLESILLVSTIIFWSLSLEWLAYHVPLFQKLVHPPPLPLIKNGKMIRANMRHELITKEELFSQLREQGVEEIKEVKEACMEGDGQISVIKYEGDTHKRTKKAL